MNTQLIGTERLLTPDEVSKLLGVPRRTIREWMYRETGPRHYRLNQKTIRYRIEDVREWLVSKEAS